MCPLATGAPKMPGLDKVNSTPVMFKLDCGATCNVLRRYNLPRTDALVPTTSHLKMYNGALENPLGKYESNVFNAANGTSYKLPFLLVRTAPTALLGAQTCQQMGLLRVRKENILSAEFPKDGVEPTTSESVSQIQLEGIMKKIVGNV